MSLTYHQQHQLFDIEAVLLRSDCRLRALFGVFGRLYQGEDIPAWEKATCGHDHFPAAAAWFVAALIAGAARISVLLRATPGLAIAIWRASAQPYSPNPPKLITST